MGFQYYNKVTVGRAGLIFLPNSLKPLGFGKKLGVHCKQSFYRG